MKIFDPIPEMRTLSIMPTFQCTAACTHCGTLSTPRNKVRLAHEHAESAIRQAASAGYGVVVFTGGEPTLAGDWLAEGIRLAREVGLVTRIVTNGWWARTQQLADTKVSALRAAGLDEINFSTGDQHARFVPVANVLRGLRAAVGHGLRVALMIEIVGERTISKATIETDPEYRAIREEFPDASIVVNESPWMPLDPSQVQRYPAGVAVNRRNLPMRDGCDSVLSTTTIEADGTIGACCGIGMRLIPELQLGNIAEVALADAAARGERDLLKRWVRAEGPERILDWASTHDPEIAWEDMYAHRCQACIRMYTDPRVRQVIREHHEEKIADVVFAEWLLYGFKGAQAREDLVATAPA